MNPMPIRRVFAAVTLAACALSLLSTTPASAEQVVVANTAPSVSSPSFTMPGGQTAFEPDAGASDEVYAYAVTVGDAETLNDLATVTVCLYQSMKEDGSTPGEGDDTCAVINPANTVLLTWTQLTDAFTKSAGASTFWALDTVTPSSRTGLLTDTTGTLTFRFTVSEAMREGTWTAKVTATDASAATAVNSAETKLVNAYSAITTRTQQTFGTLAAGVAATATDSPTVTSNGATTMSLTAGNFVNGSYSFTLLTTGGPGAAPAAGQLTYDCQQAATFTEASATRVGSAATSLGSATASGTAEGGSTVSNTCRIKHGGGRPVGTYSFTVVNTLINA